MKISAQTLIFTVQNIAHIARHDVVPQEIVYIAESLYILVPGNGNRYMMLGPTATGRMLAVILEPNTKGKVYVVTVRPADKKERGIYSKWIGEEVTS
jgi:uncharacterized DUF497 family protein